MKISKEKLIQILNIEKETSPRHSLFGYDNHNSIDITINAINNNYSVEDIYDLELEHEDETNTIEFIDYVNGEDVEIEDLLFNNISFYEEILKEKKKEMNICNKMCCECPFSNKSLKGFLANYKKEDFIQFQKNDILFPCHKIMTKEDLTIDEASNMIKNGDLKLCRGYAESIIKSAKLPIDSYLKNITVKN